MVKKYKDGGIYEGEGTLFTKKRQGKGKMTYANGEIYEGQWVDDVRCGQGELYLPRTYGKTFGKLYSYTGEWKNDKLNGFGTFTDSYTTYSGNFVDGKYNGRGTLTKKVGSLTYVGEFKGGLKSGTGSEKCPEYTYTGEFAADKFHGKGKKTLPNGDFFDGTFSYGIFKNGKVQETIGTDVYSGSYSNNNFNGRGKLTTSNGTVYSGNFKSGLRHGTFKVTLPDGTVNKEKYENGILIEGEKKAEIVADENKQAAEKKANPEKEINSNIEATANKQQSEEKKKTTPKKEATENKQSENEKKQSAGSGQQSKEKKKSTPKKETTKVKSAKKTDSIKKDDSKNAIENKLEAEKPDYSKEFDAFEKKIEPFAKKARESAKLADDIKAQCYKKRSEKMGSLSFTSIPVETFKNLIGNGSDTYKGEKLLGKFDGYGKYVWAEGDIYEGEWKSDLRTGKGIYHFTSGSTYEGQFFDSRMNGKGVFTYKNGDIEKGDYLDNKLHGYAVYIGANGDKYEGEWKNGLINGKGTYYYSSGNVYKGDWKDEKRTGKGIFTFANGDRYEGGFLDGMRHGEGIYTFANGDKDEGVFEKGTLIGKGKRIYANGDVYDGDFTDDKPTGKGVYTYADGRRLEGDFVDGKFVDNTPKKEESKQNNENSVKAVDENAMFTPEATNGGITFKDVAGLTDVKNQIIINVIEPMKDPELAKAYGITPGGKILLYGPPGTGKTFIARAIAGEIDAAFYSVSCQDLISKWLGESSERLNKLFDEVEKHEKAIIFFDEFDSVASKRDGVNESKEISRFVATFLTRVDGFKPTQNKMLLLIAATNRPWALDSAMLRGGRFDTQIYVGVPDKEAREFLVNKSLGASPLNDDVDLSELANRFEGFGGGDIVAICYKIKLEAYKKSVKLGKIQPIAKEDCDTILNNAQNNITSEELARFEAYRNGQSVE